MRARSLEISMRFKSRTATLLVLILLSSITFYGSSPQALTFEKTDKDLTVHQGSKALFKVPFGSKDEVFQAGTCVIIRRNVRPTELFPEVDSLETFQPSGKRRVYSEKDLGICRLSDGRVLTSPDQTWSVVPDEEEGMVSGFFLIHDDCRVREITFPHNGTIYWRMPGGSFTGNKTLLLPGLDFESSNGKKKVIQIRINKDGTYRIEDASSR
jgi:hypothetical protein